MTERTNIDVLKELNIAFENQSLDFIHDNIDSVLKLILNINPYGEQGSIGNLFSVVSNYIKMIVKNKNANANFVLSSALKHTKNYIGLFFIGMLVKAGANPNVYFPVKGYGNLHILAALSLRSKGGYDPYFRMICNLMRLLGSDINYPAYSYEEEKGILDLKFVEKVVDTAPGGQYGRTTITVKDFILENGKIPNEDLTSFLNNISTEDLLHILIASDKSELFNRILDTNFMKIITEDAVNTTKLFINLSIASASNIASSITEKDFPLINNLINGQPIPLYAATTSMDEELFSIYIRKGALIKYLTINHLIIYYKFFKKEDIKLYRNNYYMLLEAITIGADIDLYQMDLFTSMADYDEVESINSAFKVPKWKKLCSVVQEKPRQELKQLAFDLNLDYNMSEEKICNKLKQISLIDKAEYFESAIKRQEERVSSDTASNEEYIGTKEMPKSRCNKKSTIIKNPYAYNDARMAFYKDPQDGEVWCFTSDMFVSLLASKVNPYNGNPLPLKFVETIRAQVNILKELGVYDTNTSIKDALKDIYERSVINNIKTEYAYNTVVKCLSLYGVSEERFSTLKSITQEDTILKDICGVRIKHFDILTPQHKLVTTARVVYSLSKSNQVNPAELYQQIAQAIIGFSEEIPEDNYDQYINMFS
jgi:hypothetical protein